MTSKLTAKLSDGREFEVCSTWHAKEDNYIMIVCRPPQEKQAREWWIIEHFTSSIWMHDERFETEEEAKKAAHKFNIPTGGNEYRAIKVREVLG